MEAKPYSAEWWYQRGRQDIRKMSTPQFPKVEPYMKGWLFEFLNVGSQQ